MTDGARWSDAVADVKEAVRFLRFRADAYGIDAARVAVWGESAGGYLAAMAGVTNGLQRFEIGAHLDQSSAVAAVVDKFGPSNLAQVAADFDEQSQRASRAPDRPIATFVHGAGNAKPVSDDPDAVRAAGSALLAAAGSWKMKD